MPSEQEDLQDKFEIDAVAEVVVQTVDIDMTPGELKSLLAQLDYLERKANKSPYWKERMATLVPLLDRLKARAAVIK